MISRDDLGNGNRRCIEQLLQGPNGYRVRRHLIKVLCDTGASAPTDY